MAFIMRFDQDSLTTSMDAMIVLPQHFHISHQIHTSSSLCCQFIPTLYVLWSELTNERDKSGSDNPAGTLKDPLFSSPAFGARILSRLTHASVACPHGFFTSVRTILQPRPRFHGIVRGSHVKVLPPPV